MIQVCDLSFANNSITDTLGNYSLVSSGSVTISDHTYPANTDPILYGTDSSYNYVEFGQTATYSNGAIIQAGVPTYGSENWSVEFRARAPSVLPVKDTGLYVLFFGCSAPYDDNGTIRTGGYWAISIDSFPDATNELRFLYDYNNEDLTLKDNLDLTSWHLYRVTKTAEDILTLHIDGVLVATIDIEQQTGFKSRATLGSFALLGAVDEFPTANHIQTSQGVRLADVKVYADPMGHAEKAISLDNLSRVFRNYNTWLGAQLSGQIGDGTLTIKVNGSTAGTFTANQSTATTANITVPTAVSELTNDSGYLTSSSNLDASKLTSGTVDIARLPQGALERLVKVANEAARYALTTADVQLGDTVQQLDTGIMYIVTDDDHLDSAAGYTEYTAGTAASVPWSGVTGKPTFAAVATSGAYSDLTGTPALAAVATSGAYSDLTGTPTIPTVNNATLTIQKNGSTVGTFSANQATDETIDITVPTKTSDLTNDSNFVESSDLATVATSGSYNDLSNKPTIPTVNNATLTIQKNGTTVKTFTANASSNVTANITVPTKTSDLTNDSGFITSDDTKIPLAGSNAISGDLIPATTDSVNLGSPSYQWNNAYIKSLTINGVACGDILTHNASEFVNVSSNQTIGGIKTFSDGLFASKSGQGDLATLEDSSINSTNEDANGMPLTGHTNSLKIKGSQFNVIPCMLTGQVYTSGDTSAELRVYKYKDTNRAALFIIRYSYASNVAQAQFVNCNITTNADGVYSIGSSIARWKDCYTNAINGLNPGALSLPSNSYVNVDTTNWDLTCQNELLGSFTPTADGWLMLHIANSGTSEVNFWVIGGVIRINNKSTLNTSDNNNFNMITIPVEKDVTYNIYGNASEYVAGRSIAYCRFMPCRGNV